MLEILKRGIRIVEAALTPRRSSVTFLNRDLAFVRSTWWHDAHQNSFNSEIVPYFRPLDAKRRYRTICDVGSATGLFTCAARTRFPEAQVYAFEPSWRQRIILRRNLGLNHFSDGVTIVPFGLWRSTGSLAFRTHGALGALQLVTELPASLIFDERVPVISLDEWASKSAVNGIDLIKMDIEGAELEALEGSRTTLLRDRPDVLLQAYHIRDSTRTFERCAAQLEALGYTVREIGTDTGLIYGTAR